VSVLKFWRDTYGTIRTHCPFNGRLQVGLCIGHGGALKSGIGTVEGYGYSEVNKNSGIVWSEATFTEYLIDPSAKIPGTKMIFSDKNEQEGQDLWAYLKQFGSDGNAESRNISATGRLDRCSEGDIWREFRSMWGI
jgi:hypothetical protein